jgi:formyltetrahydrofolate synthetase
MAEKEKIIHLEDFGAKTGLKPAAVVNKVMLDPTKPSNILIKFEVQAESVDAVQKACKDLHDHIKKFKPTGVGLFNINGVEYSWAPQVIYEDKNKKLKEFDKKSKGDTDGIVQQKDK